ncbi:type II toxin-antitoxin system VapC family toxin [Microbispora oryzae]|uniref:type II toxin-antitoxin system VapC family toxin n=1 Tax=Microbispora oryzae TaxID=2806554 RepID=UPI0027DC9B92|nr:type II toxin-antitoxin system VapC family toxin [Microbispora oryzae]
MEFVDTSVLCNLLDVPGKNQQREALKEELPRKSLEFHLILPVTTVIETGNHIAQLPNGHDRRDRAVRLHDLLNLVIRGEAPWVLHTVEWGEPFLRELLRGGGTGIDLADHAMTGLGLGDLCILTERELYRRRVTGVEVGIWTLDEQLKAHA